MKHRSLATVLACLSATSLAAGNLHAEDAWWNDAWTGRQPVTLDTSADAADLAEPVTDATVLVRLFAANFQFQSAAENGGDLRFVSADGKTVYPHQVESYDSLIGEAFIWVKLPEAKTGTQEKFYLYYGNATPEAAKAESAFDSATVLDYHFAERGAAPVDATENKNNAKTVGAIAEGSIIGVGMRLLGGTPVPVPPSESLAWSQGQAMTLSLWVKPQALQDKAVLVSRGEGADSFRLMLDQGVPIVELASGSSATGEPLPVAVWSHLAVVADGAKVRVFLNGAPYGSVIGGLPALNTPIVIGGTASATAGLSNFTGDVDELVISDVARSDSWVKLAAISQGASDAGQRTLSLGQAEGGEVEEQSHLMEHLSLFGDIANNMMFDGWIAIGVCAIMIVIGWTVAVKKFLYLNSIEKGTKVFLNQWKALSTDLTALNPEDSGSVSSLGGKVDGSDQGLIEKSPLYHIYQIGSEEIRHRLDKDNNRVEGLSGRSIQAIRASLDAGLVHESHRLTDGLVYLTISIAGGPYVGLLGTVVGVMITFAIIAKSGEVNVNSIAPGIASALLATVVGLVVAIPALFIYSYLNGRIKNSLALMQVFIDEFVAKMAEFYRPASGSEPDQSRKAH
jgi:biopolymer transport protein ExbB